jgi:hypothetical protein
VLRLLVTPRWLGLTALALLAVITCVALSVWQFDRAHRKPRPVALADEQVVALPDVLGSPPDVAFPSGLLVRASGRYAGGAFVVPAASGPGRWTASSFTPVATTRPVAVVRGSAVPAASPPRTDDVVVTGRLQPPASTGLTAAALRARGLDPRGYVVLTSQVPADARPAVVVASPVPLRSPGLRWQNTIYAVQWMMFAGFFVFLWVRFFREELAESRAA